MFCIFNSELQHCVDFHFHCNFKLFVFCLVITVKNVLLFLVLKKDKFVPVVMLLYELNYLKTFHWQKDNDCFCCDCY